MMEHCALCGETLLSARRKVHVSLRGNHFIVSAAEQVNKVVLKTVLEERNVNMRPSLFERFLILVIYLFIFSPSSRV